MRTSVSELLTSPPPPAQSPTPSLQESFLPFFRCAPSLRGGDGSGDLPAPVILCISRSGRNGRQCGPKERPPRPTAPRHTATTPPPRHRNTAPHHLTALHPPNLSSEQPSTMTCGSSVILATSKHAGNDNTSAEPHARRRALAHGVWAEGRHWGPDGRSATPRRPAAPPDDKHTESNHVHIALGERCAGVDSAKRYGASK
jgi:pyruvate/2-oxoglutarate dehydrogenase complex dihydrolipoamide acyltransferase (E2) component